MNKGNQSRLDPDATVLFFLTPYIHPGLDSRIEPNFFDWPMVTYSAELDV